MLGTRIGPELVEELCWSRNERRTRTRAAKRALAKSCARRVTVCTCFEATSGRLALGSRSSQTGREARQRCTYVKWLVEQPRIAGGLPMICGG